LSLQIISPPRSSENSLAILDLHSRLYLTDTYRNSQPNPFCFGKL
jgi:hypothetical protein